MHLTRLALTTHVCAHFGRMSIGSWCGSVRRSLSTKEEWRRCKPPWRNAAAWHLCQVRPSLTSVMQTGQLPGSSNEPTQSDITLLAGAAGIVARLLQQLQRAGDEGASEALRTLAKV